MPLIKIIGHKVDACDVFESLRVAVAEIRTGLGA